MVITLKTSLWRSWLYGLIACLLQALSITYVLAADSDAYISLSSQSPSIYLGDSVAIDVESSGLLHALEVTTLQSTTGFLRETTGTRIAVISGRVREIAIRRMEFIPEAEGTYIFGPLTSETPNGSVTSNSVAVTVLPAMDLQWQPNIDDVKINVTLSKSNPYIGEQFIADIRLLHRYPIANEHINLPNFDAFDVLPVFENRRTLLEQDGGWRQVAWRYLLHAKHSGVIALSPISWQGTMTRTRTQRGNFALQENTIKLTVQASNGKAWWLPASAVTLSDSWSSDVSQLSAGDEILRTITLSAQGVLSSQLPTVIPIATRSFNSTLISTDRQQQAFEDHTQAQATYTFRYNAQSPVPVFLDTVRVLWWNVNTQQTSEAIIPARRVDIGLPDRANLLAELASSKGMWGMLQYQLTQLQPWQPLLVVLACGLSMALLLTRLRAMLNALQRVLTQRRMRRAWMSACQKQDWLHLYELINRHYDSGLPSIDNQSTRAIPVGIRPIGVIKGSKITPQLANTAELRSVLALLSGALFAQNTRTLTCKEVQQHIAKLTFMLPNKQQSVNNTIPSL